MIKNIYKLKIRMKTDKNKLTLDNKFNQPINNLPNSITHLTLGYEFN